ncbi:Pentatricopeptide repeat [Dillenia turbinata]|uniref:Pentatricopeptide repeat n=1 Tax=Dillenia turbinata TaxID=194707 RepID=A0AAN8ZPI5_9MAGN
MYDMTSFHLILLKTLQNKSTQIPNYFPQFLPHTNSNHYLIFLENESCAFYYNNVIRSYTKLNVPNKALYVYVSMSSWSSFDVKMGIQLHCVGIKNGFESNDFCESGIASMYCKGGWECTQVFEQNRERKLGSWNAIIGGLSQGGRAKEATHMFLRLMKCGFRPDDVTMLVEASGSLRDLDLAMQLHKCVLQARTWEKSDIVMLNSLIDLYGKCGRMDLAGKVFSRMVESNVSSWTSMIVGHAMHGHVHDALECFHWMREVGVEPNYVTFIGVLSACVHGGMVQEGKHYFNLMKNVYHIVPKLQHYGCMANLLGHAGLFEEAREMIEKMPMEANSVV